MDKYLMGDSLKPWKGGVAQSITFVITQDCNLRCKYCYMTSKNQENIMSYETGKRAIDYFLTNSNLFTADAVVLEFIGGEPLLEIDLMDRLTDYFKLRAYELDHKWFTFFRVSISTNGILYSTEKVQKYIKKNAGKVSIGITIDGTKEKNDLQRVYPDGSGTYEDIVKNVSLWKKQFPGATTKVTIGHDDLPYIKESIIHLWNLGLKEVPANVVFEDVWEEGDDIIFYNQLRELADYIIENNMWLEYNTSLFSQGIGYPLSEEELRKNSCGTGTMIAVDARGNLYPCIRFMDYSLNNEKGYVTGNIYDGINREKLRPFYALNVKNQSDEECINCDVASGCQWCTGYNYDESGDGTIFRRSKSICKLHKARVRANNYLWSRLEREKQVVLKRRRSGNNFLFVMLADNSVSICNYEGRKKASAVISEKKLYEIAEYCLINFVTPVIIHSDNNEITRLANSIFKELDYINIYSAGNVGAYSYRDIIFHNLRSIKDEKEKKNCCILKFEQEEMHKLSEGVILALKYYERVNIQWVYGSQIDLKIYYDQLEHIADELVVYYKDGKLKQVNIITDDLFNSYRTNCSFGYNNFVIAPDEKIYACPAMYYAEEQNYINDFNELHFAQIKKFDLGKNPICNQCDFKHCKWCFYYSQKITGEYGVPASMQCKITQTERKATDYLCKKMKENGLEKYCENYVEMGNFDDPILKRDAFTLSLLNFSYDV